MKINDRSNNYKNKKIDQERVLIIGGGIAGLTLANVLKCQGVPYKIFERDLSPTSREQGWALSLDFCLPLLKTAMDPVKFVTLGQRATVNPDNPEQSTLVMVDGNNNNSIISAINPPSDSTVYRINRKRLRNWLLEGAGDNDHHIAWNKEFDHYALTDDGIDVTFKDGTIEHGGLLVGADGNSSPVCQQLIGPELYEKTTNNIRIHSYGTSYWVGPKLRKELAKISPSCMIIPASNSKADNHSTCLFVSLVEIDHSREKTPYLMMWGMTWYMNKNKDGFDVKSSVPLSSTLSPQQQLDSTSLLEKAKAQALYVGFTGPFLKLIMETPIDSKVASLSSKERIPHPFLQAPCNSRIALVGDSAHPMVQLCGIGGNHAVIDACILGLELGRAYKSKRPFEEAVIAYNKEMVPRGQHAVISSRKAAETFHGSYKDSLSYMTTVTQRQSTDKTTGNTEYHCWKNRMTQHELYLQKAALSNKKPGSFRRFINKLICSSDDFRY